MGNTDDTHDPDELVSFYQAPQRIPALRRYKPATLVKMRQRGQIPAIYLNRRYYLTPSLVREWIRSHAVIVDGDAHSPADLEDADLVDTDLHGALA